MAKRSKLLRWSASKRWAVVTTTLSAGVVTIIKRLVPLRRDSIITLRDLTASFGLRDDPLDEQVQFMIIVLDPDNIPLADNNDNRALVLESADWVDQEVWRSIGTDAGPIKLDDEAVVESIDTSYSADDFGDESMWICAAVLSSTTSEITFVGKLDYDVAYRQTTYNNDGSEIRQHVASLGGA